MKQLLQQALDALIDSVDDSRDVLNAHLADWGPNYRPERIAAMRKTIADGEAAIAALQAELAKPEPKPVGYVYWNKGHADGALDNQNLKPGTPLYSAPTEPTSQTRNCSRHPDAPHGPDGAGCKCHNWAPGDAS